MGNESTIQPLFAINQHQAVEQYLQFEFVSAVFLAVLSPITVLANIVLLVTIWKDALNCFRTPTTYFTIGLAVADLLCGLTVQPIFALFYFAQHLKVLSGAILKLFEVAKGISTVTLSSSYLLVLGLSASQLVAVRYPHDYKKMVTKRNVLAYVILSCMYFTLFSLLQLLTEIDPGTILKINVALHSTLITVVLAVVHLLLYRSLKQQYQSQKRGRGLVEYQLSFNQHWVEKSRRRQTAESRRKRYFAKQVTILAVHLGTILLVSALFHVLILNVLLYRKFESIQEELYINIAVRVSDLMMFVKVALDAFIYAWRLPTYRKAFVLTLCSCQTTRITKV